MKSCDQIHRGGEKFSYIMSSAACESNVAPPAPAPALGPALQMSVGVSSLAVALSKWIGGNISYIRTVWVQAAPSIWSFEWDWLGLQTREPVGYLYRYPIWDRVTPVGNCLWLVSKSGTQPRLVNRHNPRHHWIANGWLTTTIAVFNMEKSFSIGFIIMESSVLAITFITFFLVKQSLTMSCDMLPQYTLRTNITGATTENCRWMFNIQEFTL